MSGIPDNSRPPGASKNLHNLSFWCLKISLFIAKLVMLVLLYVHDMTLLSFCIAYCSIVALANNIFNILKGIRLPSLPVSTLYLLFTLFHSYKFVVVL